MRSRTLVGAYWRLARDLARAFGPRYVPEVALRLVAYPLTATGGFFGAFAVDREGLCPCNPPRSHNRGITWCMAKV